MKWNSNKIYTIQAHDYYLISYELFKFCPETIHLNYKNNEAFKILKFLTNVDVYINGCYAL